jgi:hypothetical protein
MAKLPLLLRGNSNWHSLSNPSDHLEAVRQIPATPTVYQTGEYAGRLVLNKSEEVRFTIEAGGEMHASVFDVSP